MKLMSVFSAVRFFTKGSGLLCVRWLLWFSHRVML